MSQNESQVKRWKNSGFCVSERELRVSHYEAKATHKSAGKSQPSKEMEHRELWDIGGEFRTSYCGYWGIVFGISFDL